MLQEPEITIVLPGYASVVFTISFYIRETKRKEEDRKCQRNIIAFEIPFYSRISPETLIPAFTAIITNAFLQAGFAKLDPAILLFNEYSN